LATSAELLVRSDVCAPETPTLGGELGNGHARATHGLQRVVAEVVVLAVAGKEVEVQPTKEARVVVVPYGVHLYVVVPHVDASGVNGLDAHAKELVKVLDALFQAMIERKVFIHQLMVDSAFKIFQFLRVEGLVPME
jgi:hypothetical protein